MKLKRYERAKVVFGRDIHVAEGEAKALNHLIDKIEEVYTQLGISDGNMLEVLKLQAAAMGWPEPEVIES